MEILGNIIIFIVVCTLVGYALTGAFGTTVLMWAWGSLAVAFFGGLMSIGG